MRTNRPPAGIHAASLLVGIPSGLLAALLAVSGGCSRRAPSASSARDASPGPDLAPPPLASVHVEGTVSVEEPAPGAATIVVAADGPCFQPGTHYHASARVEPGARFSLRVFPPAGTRLEICAIRVAPGQETSVFSGRFERGPILAHGRAPVRLEDADVRLARGAEVRVPAGLDRTR